MRGDNYFALYTLSVPNVGDRLELSDDAALLRESEGRIAILHKGAAVIVWHADSSFTVIAQSIPLREDAARIDRFLPTGYRLRTSPTARTVLDLPNGDSVTIYGTVSITPQPVWM